MSEPEALIVPIHVGGGRGWLYIAQVGGPDVQDTDEVAMLTFFMNIRCELDMPFGGLYEGMLKSCDHPSWSRYICGDALQQLQDLASFSKLGGVGYLGGSIQISLHFGLTIGREA